MANNSIVPSNGNNGIAKLSLTSSVARGIDLAASIFGKDFVPGEPAFWEEALAPYQPNMIEWAFREHCKSEMFFPRPIEIIERIQERLAEEAPGPGEVLRKQLAEENRKKGIM